MHWGPIQFPLLLPMGKAEVLDIKSLHSNILTELEITLTLPE